MAGGNQKLKEIAEELSCLEPEGAESSLRQTIFELEPAIAKARANKNSWKSISLRLENRGIKIDVQLLQNYCYQARKAKASDPPPKARAPSKREKSARRFPESRKPQNSTSEIVATTSRRRQLVD
jgi:hypothetical protein